MIVAQHQRCAGEHCLRQDLAPPGEIILTRPGGSATRAHRAHTTRRAAPPRSGAAPRHRAAVREAPSLRPPGEARSACRCERIEGKFVGPHGGSPGEQPCVEAVAEILDSRNPCALSSAWICGALSPSRAEWRPRRYRPDILEGRRRIHQHDPPGAVVEAIIAPERGIAGEAHRGTPPQPDAARNFRIAASRSTDGSLWAFTLRHSRESGNPEPQPHRLAWTPAFAG